jgi:hypothetical protein
MQFPAPTEMDLAIGYKGRIATCEDALLVPWGTDREHVCHVTDPGTGRLIYRHNNLCDLPQDAYAALSLDGPRQRLRGTYIIAGYLSPHLGHCLTGTISSLWPLSQLDGQIDGILSFSITTQPRHVEDRNEAAVAAILRGLGIHLPILTVRQPTQVDRLILAEKGIGSYKSSRGSSYYHRFMRQRLALPEEELGKRPRTKLYITRSELQAQRRGIVGEAAINRTFAEAGYEVIAPEKLPLSEQIAKYQTARVIVGLDGTPFHLIPSVCPSDAKIAIIRRRFSKRLDGVDFVGQFQAATGITPTDIDCIIGEWRPIEPAKSNAQLAVLDIEKVYQDLVSDGFLDATSNLHVPSSEEIQSHLDAAAVRVGAGYEFVDFRFGNVA